MLQQRFEYDPSKRFVFLKIPLNTTTFHCSIEVSNTAICGEVDLSSSGEGTIVSPEFPCRCLRGDPSKFAITLIGIDNSTVLREIRGVEECFRFKYRLSSTTTAEDDADEEQILVPLHNNVHFSYSYGTYKDFGMGVGNYDVKLLYKFPDKQHDAKEEKGSIISSWISPSPWRITWSVAPVKNLLTGIIGKTKGLLMLDGGQQTDDHRSHDS